MVTDALRKAILGGDAQTAVSLASALVEQGMSPKAVLEEVLIPAIQEAGRLWERGEFFIPELLAASSAMKAAMGVVSPKAEGATGQGPVVVIGTIQGDIHDIGKTLVAGVLEASGFSVHDLGVDVAPQTFVAEAMRRGARLICVSALLTTTMLSQRTVVEEKQKARLRDVAVMVGGAPVTREWATRIGAEGFAPDAFSAVEEARRLLGLG